MQKAAGSYLIFISCENAMRRTDNKQDQKISHCGHFPPFIMKVDRRKPYQFPEWCVERSHLFVIKGMSQQKPIRQTPAYQRSEKALRLRDWKMDAPNQHNGMKNISWG